MKLFCCFLYIATIRTVLEGLFFKAVCPSFHPCIRNVCEHYFMNRLVEFRHLRSFMVHLLKHTNRLDL